MHRLGADSSFNGSQRSASNSIAGLSRGSMSSTGSKGIRNFLGGKFKKRAEEINKLERSQKSKANPNPLGRGGPGLII